MRMPASPPLPLEIEQYRLWIVRYIRYLLHDATDAEDLAHIGSKGISALTACANVQRTGVRQENSSVEDLPIEERDQPSPFVIVQKAEMGECVDQHIAPLSDPQKACHCCTTLTEWRITRLLDSWRYP